MFCAQNCDLMIDKRKKKLNDRNRIRNDRTKHRISREKITAKKNERRSGIDKPNKKNSNKPVHVHEAHEGTRYET